MQAASPVFIVGEAQSGSSLLNRMLHEPAMSWWLATLNHLVLRSYFFYAWQARG